MAINGNTSVILVLIGGAVGRQQRRSPVLLISLGLNFFSYYYSDRIAIK
jgi:heat shock protein HtpX